MNAAPAAAAMMVEEAGKWIGIAAAVFVVGAMLEMVVAAANVAAADDPTTIDGQNHIHYCHRNHSVMALAAAVVVVVVRRWILVL